MTAAELAPVEYVEGQVELPGMVRVGRAAPGLPAEDLAALRLAGEFWPDAAAKEQAITARFGVPPVRFYQRVSRLLDDPAALAADPVVVNRLLRIRAARRHRLGLVRSPALPGGTS